MNTDIAAQRAIDRLKSGDFDQLSEIDQTVAAVWLTDAEVSNNGFAHYYLSKRGDLAFHAPTALYRIGAKQLATIVAEANALFEPDGPSRDRTARKAQLQALNHAARHKVEELESRYFAAEEDVDERLEEFLNGCRNQL